MYEQAIDFASVLPLELEAATLGGDITFGEALGLGAGIGAAIGVLTVVAFVVFPPAGMVMSIGLAADIIGISTGVGALGGAMGWGLGEISW